MSGILTEEEQADGQPLSKLGLRQTTVQGFTAVCSFLWDSEARAGQWDLHHSLVGETNAVTLNTGTEKPGLACFLSLFPSLSQWWRHLLWRL